MREGLQVSEESLQATGLPEQHLETYRLFRKMKSPKDSYKKRLALAKRLGVNPKTVKLRIDRVEKKLRDPDSMKRVGQGTSTNPPSVDNYSDPKKYAKAITKLSNDQKKSIVSAAREVGVSPQVASRIVKELEGELQPLTRAIEEVRLEELTKGFGTLARDAISAITHEKLEKANAQQLAVVAGVSIDKWQLLRGQPTQRTEIHDRRKMDELIGLVIEEAKRRNVEIDITPDGSINATPSPYRNAPDQRFRKQIESGDPKETLAPA